MTAERKKSDERRREKERSADGDPRSRNRQERDETRRDERRGEPRERLNGSKTRGKIAIAACTDELICVT